MNITLAAAQKQFIDAQVKSGRYVDASEVVRGALRLMEARTAVVHPIRGDPSAADIEALADGDGPDVEDDVNAVESAEEDQRDLRRNCSEHQVIAHQVTTAVSAYASDISAFGQNRTKQASATIAPERKPSVFALGVATVSEGSSDEASRLDLVFGCIKHHAGSCAAVCLSVKRSVARAAKER